LPEGKIELSTKEQAALTRLIQRLKQQQGDDSTNSAALLKLLTCPDAQQLEDMYTSSLQQRGEKELKGTTVQDQVIQEYVALLKLGHMLVFETPDGGNSPSAGDVDCSLTTEVRYRLPDGTVKTATVSLMFPASSGSVSRIMDSWYAARGGRPSKTQRAAAKEQANHRGAPIRWNTVVLFLLFWQAELMQALVAVK